LVFLFWIATRGKNMKRILLTTTSLVLAAGVAQAEVTFSGKAEFGASRTAKADAVAAVAGRDALITGVALTATDDAADFVDGDMVTTATTTTSGTDKIEYVNGVLTTTKATTNSATTAAPVTADELAMAQGVVATAKALVVSEQAVYDAQVTEAAQLAELDDLNEAKAELALAEAMRSDRHSRSSSSCSRRHGSLLWLRHGCCSIVHIWTTAW
jgi:hypothetical protein